MKSLFLYIKNHTLLVVMALLALTATGGLIHYTGKALASGSESTNQAPQAPEVEVAIIQPEEMRIWDEFSGRMVAVDRVEIRPLVSGRITKVLFEEGAIVQKGNPLFVIDPRPFEAEIAVARAALSSANSQENLAKTELERAKKLVKSGHVSQSVYDERLNGYKVSQAAIDAAKAALTQAELDYEYAHIKAPVSGRISRAEITVGNIVESGSNAPLLTTIVSHDKLYAEFDVDEQTYIRTVRQESQSKRKMPVELTLSGDKSVVYEGEIHAFDNQLDTSTGTIRARAIFANVDGALIPGMYANIRLGSPGKQNILLVSEKAIGTDQDKKYVYVVQPDNTVAYREIKLGRSVEGRRVILSGLKAGEKVMVNNLQRVRPGMQVQPVVVANQASPTAVFRN